MFDHAAPALHELKTLDVAALRGLRAGRKSEPSIPQKVGGGKLINHIGIFPLKRSVFEVEKGPFGGSKRTNGGFGFQNPSAEMPANKGNATRPQLAPSQGLVSN